jgi:hypothetical protein
MKQLILITAMAALFSLPAAAQTEPLPFNQLPDNVKNIISTDLQQNAATIDDRIDEWAQSADYSPGKKHKIIGGRADTYAYTIYAVNGGLVIEAFEKYATAQVDSFGDNKYGATMLFKCTNHRPSHSTSSISGEASLKQKYGCTGFSFSAR